MKKIVIAATALLMLFASCQKQEQRQISPKQTTGSTSGTTARRYAADDAANPSNPYDIIGYNHNVALQETRDAWSPAAAKSTDIYNAIEFYYQNTGSSTTLLPYSTLNPMVNSALADTPAEYHNYISGMSLSRSVKSYLTSINDVVFDNSFVSYDEFKTAVMVLEDQAIADPSLSNAEKQTVLESASVARYSMLYWQNEASGQNPPGSNPVIMRSIWGWAWRIGYTAAGDVIGGAVAGIAGAVVFSASIGSAVF